MTTNNPARWAALAAWGTDPRMSELETLMWRGERHPEFSSTGIVLELLDRVPDWERFRAAHEWGCRIVPRLRERVVEPALPVGAPAWAADPDFELDRHLRHVHLCNADVGDVLKLAEDIAVQPFDRSRPLWTGTLIDGLADGRAAYVLRSHHSLMDGYGLMQLFANLHSDRTEPSPNKPSPVPRTARAPTPVGLAAQRLAEGARNAPGEALRFLGSARRVLVAPGEAARYAASLRRVAAAPAAGNPSPLLARQSGRDWRFGVLECELAGLKAAGRRVGGSVNDAYLAALLGGLRRYHEQLGHELGDVPVVLPVSIRRPDDPIGGNRFTSAFFAGPSSTEDPAERMAAIRSAVLSSREEPALDFLGALAPLLIRTPSALLGRLLRVAAPRVELSASNVPGLVEPAYAAGARVERMYIFGPLPGVSMLSTLCSYVGTCCIGVNCDGAVYEDTERLWACLRAGLDEVLALGEAA
jgi:WS/DGAT/MGAT family acyltransferase